jgi:hypothetical protein
MTQKIYSLAAALIMTAVLILLLNPATPGVIAPTGCKAFHIFFILALNLFVGVLIVLPVLIGLLDSSDDFATRHVLSACRSVTLLC